jgi:O-acetyl-ADP-ribose deacetylase (regulator of RNase III)
MIEYKRGNLLSEDTEALVNTVNCVGIMGRGIALAFKKAFPANFTEYEDACSRGEVQPGRMFVHDTRQITNPRYIINFPTKRHWRNPSRISDIDTGLIALVAEIQERDIRSIALPALGCGNGGLDWDEVRPRIERAFEPLQGVQVTVYEPEGASNQQLSLMGI